MGARSRKAKLAVLEKAAPSSATLPDMQAKPTKDSMRINRSLAWPCVAHGGCFGLLPRKFSAGLGFRLPFAFKQLMLRFSQFGGDPRPSFVSLPLRHGQRKQSESSGFGQIYPNFA